MPSAQPRMTSKTVACMVMGAGTYMASRAFTFAPGAPSLRSVLGTKSSDRAAGAGQGQGKARMPMAMLGVGAAAAIGTAVQARKRRARGSVQACAVAFEVEPMPASASAEVQKAKQQVDLLVWSANQLDSQNSPQAAMMKTKADQAVAAYHALLQNQPAPSFSSQPASASQSAYAAPAPAVASGPDMSGVQPLPADASAEVKKAKEQVDLLMWCANKLSSEGSPQAAMIKSKADQAVATYHTLLQNQPASSSQPASAPVVASAPVMAAAQSLPAAADEELKKAKQQVDLLTWSANNLASSNSPQAAMMKAKADEAVARYNALLQNA